MENEFLTEAELEGTGLDSLEATFVEQESAFIDEPSKEGKQETETPKESSTETNENEKEPSQEGEPGKDNTPMEENLPFHKHPRWKEMLDKNKNLEEQLSNIKLDVSTQLEEIKTKPTETIPESFRKLYGDDINIWNAWKEYMSEEKANIEKGIFDKIKAESEAKIKEETIAKENEKKTQTYFENQFSEIEAADGKIDRNAIVKILEKYHCVDPETSLYDIKAAYDIYKQINKTDNVKSNKRKEIASTTTSSGGTVSDTKAVAWDSLKGKGWGVD